MFAAHSHLGRGGVAHVRVVLPDDHLRAGAHEAAQRDKRIEHVLIAQVPRLSRSVVHHAIVTLRVCHYSRVLQGVKVVFAVARDVLDSFLQ